MTLRIFLKGVVMNTGKTLFVQLMDFLPWSTFNRYVARYGGDKGVRTLTCAEQFRAMAFAQLTCRESLRESNLKAHRVYSSPTDRSTGILCDQTIALDGFYSKRDYPTHLRRVRFYDPETGKTPVFNRTAVTPCRNQSENKGVATICRIFESATTDYDYRFNKKR